MQMRQLRSHFRQPHLTRRELVTRGAAELLETLGSAALRGRALILRYFGDDAHRLQRGNAAFKPLSPFLALLGEPELAIVAYRVAILAAVSFEDVLSQLLIALTGSDHLVEPVLLGEGRD